ncbi:MAG: hypothetical protein HOY78_23655 [Saccharothrix sp.]|nr:hypothetical protein [Saccharothrix sp.]
MTAVHRPLSAWVSRWDGAALAPVNDGDDRADARWSTDFDIGWTRTAVQWRDKHVLGLSDGEATVVELDDYGRPIPVTLEIASAVEHVELDWPRARPRPEDFAGAAIPLRYWLVQRLDEEGDPDVEAFHVLPWDLLDRAVASLITTLDRREEPAELVEMRYWLTPAVRGLAAPLEQLDHGLRTNDDRVARLGASSLLDNLRHIPLDRVPGNSVAGLIPLVHRLGAANPLFRHTARVVEARLAGERGPRMAVRLNSALDDAASDDDTREHTVLVEDELFHVRVQETQAGWARVLVRLPNPDEPEFGAPRGSFAPIRVVPRGGSPEVRYWVALYPEGEHLVGSVSFAVPHGWSEVDCDGVPVSEDDLAAASPDELAPSLFAANRRTARQWIAVADGLAEGHAVRRAVQRFVEES